MPPKSGKKPKPPSKGAKKKELTETINQEKEGATINIGLGDLPDDHGKLRLRTMLPRCYHDAIAML